MSEEKRFSRESFIYVFGESLSKSLAFVLLPIYTWYLSVDDFAILSLVMGLWPVLVIVLGQGFSTYLIRGYYEHTDKKRFFGTVLCFAVFVALCIASVIHLIGPWLFDWIFKEVDYKPYLQYGVFFAVFRAYFTHVVSYYRAKRQAATSVAMSFVLFSINLIAVLIAIFVLDAKLIGILNAQVAAFTLVAIIYTIKIFPEISLKFQFAVIVPGILFVLPLIPHSFSGWIVNHVSRIFIERNMSLADLSVYSVVLQLALILSVINNGLNQAWIPFVYSNYDGPDFKRLFKVSAQRTVLLVITIGAVISLFAKELLLLMGKPEYLSGLFVLPILLLSYVFQIVYYVYVVLIVYNKEPKFLPVISISSGLVAILLNFVLVPILGIYGAAFCTNVSFLLMAILAFAFSRRYIRVNIISRRMIYYLMSVILVLMFSFLYLRELSLIPHVLTNFVLIAILSGLLIQLKLMNLKNIKELIQSILPFTFS